MTTSTLTQPNATIGSCSCNVANNPHFTKFVATRFFFVPLNTSPQWYVVTDTGNTEPFQIVAFRLPNVGDQVAKHYLLGPGSPVSVDYHSAVTGEHLPFTTTGGELTVTVDVSQKKIKASFKLTAVHGSRTVHLSDGALEVEGYSDEPKKLDSGTVKATITGAVTHDYVSTAVGLSDSPLSNFPNSIGGTSEDITGRPIPHQYFLSLWFAKNLLPATYSITPDSNEVRALFIDASSGLDAFRATSGKAIVQEMPQTNPLGGRLKVVFDFKAISDDGVGKVSVTNGEMNIER